MASGNGPRDSIVSVKASEEYHRFFCSPCGRISKSNGASAYCVDCEEYLCSQCNRYHDRMAKRQAHTVLDENHVDFEDPPKITRAKTLKATCKRHDGQLTNTYCGAHDVLVCGVCVSIDHRYD